jgi:serine/threonine protein kinase
LSDSGKLETAHLDDSLLGEGGVPVDPYVGKTVGGRYKLLRRLGGGGMGAVYEAEHAMIGRHVAVKLLHAQYASDIDVVRRFLNEARAAAMIGHPNILECTDMGRTDEGSPFLVLELLKGRDLASLIKSSGPMSIGRSVRIALDVCSALKAAHEREIVHRDIKPENVFIATGDDGIERVKVLDFGISKFGEGKQSGPGTATGQMLGTPAYMAPEQIHDASRVDRRTDVYAVGVLLYQMLSSQFPFYADTLPMLFIKIATESPRPIDAHRPDLPPALVDAITRAIEKDPEDRFTTVDELASAIAPFVGMTEAPPAMALTETLPAGATPMVISSKRVPTTPPPAGRPPYFAIAVGALAFAVLAVGAITLTNVPGTSVEVEAPPPTSLPPVMPISPPATTPAIAATPEPVRLTVHSSIDGATLMLRGASHALPFEDLVAPGSAPELLEVTAHGHEGRRFWVELDRSVVLDVDLPRGRGTRDADARETQRAVEGARALAAPTHASPIEAPPVTTVAPTTSPDTARVPPPPTGVYTGPSGDIPDEI